MTRRTNRITHGGEAQRLGLLVIPTEDLLVERCSAGDETVYTLGGRPVPEGRISELNSFPVPPAWTDVRMALDPAAHIQVIGNDAKGRRQYIYHDRWTDVREAVKAARLKRFGKALPRIRDAISEDITKPLSDDRGLAATALRLVDRQWVRAGHEQYAANGTAGTATLLNKHVDESDGELTLDFTAKSGKEAKVRLRDPALKRRLRALKKRGGKRLFQPRRNAAPLNATQLNAYLSDIAEADVSLKDFRTFGGSALALEQLCKTADKPTRKHAVAAVKQVAEKLRNTPTVARNSYVHSPLLDVYLDGKLDPGLTSGRRRNNLDAGETGLMRFLEGR
ncbi:DNA topoisomerase IB [Ahrensia sp. R2A130]|uniref:DNA topoisomerase IB n=1 Tax=Ahrensia sp. R2A130 TaxID=744979 RepID=UPI0001E08399|nr:DNA topoisomerase IB [Ahrensia sp. R2A130]EFL90493.1 DNA topoisomerase [Ahrensia sp. R2A130]